MPERSQFILLFFAFSFGMILSNLLGQNQKEKPIVQEEVLFVYRGIDKTWVDLPEDAAKVLLAKDAKNDKNRRRFLENTALQLHLQEYAKKENIDINQAGDKLFKLSSPDDKDVAAFYTQHSANIQKPFHVVEEEITSHLKRQYAQEARQRIVAELTERGDLAILPDARAIPSINLMKEASDKRL